MGEITCPTDNPLRMARCTCVRPRVSRVLWCPLDIRGNTTRISPQGLAGPRVPQFLLDTEAYLGASSATTDCVIRYSPLNV
jgi:hypothetical protein